MWMVCRPARQSRNEKVSPTHVQGMPWRGLVGAALAVLFASRGWSIAAGPGEPVTATRDGLVVEPFQIVERLATGDTSAR